MSKPTVTRAQLTTPKRRALKSRLIVSGVLTFAASAALMWFWDIYIMYAASFGALMYIGLHGLAEWSVGIREPEEPPPGPPGGPPPPPPLPPAV